VKGATVSDNMENFDDDFGAPPPADVDPAAEFLAKEQEELGEIGEDLGLAPPQEISAFKEEGDFASNDLQVRIFPSFLLLENKNILNEL